MQEKMEWTQQEQKASYCFPPAKQSSKWTQKVKTHVNSLKKKKGIFLFTSHRSVCVCVRTCSVGAHTHSHTHASFPTVTPEDGWPPAASGIKTRCCTQPVSRTQRDIEFRTNLSTQGCFFSFFYSVLQDKQSDSHLHTTIHDLLSSAESFQSNSDKGFFLFSIFCFLPLWSSFPLAACEEEKKPLIKRG